jgi:hypothetical protein
MSHFSFHAMKPASLPAAIAVATIATMAACGGGSQPTANAVVVPPSPATQLAVATQPSSASSSTVVFAAQPVVEVRDANNALVTSSTAAVTATVASGPGTLSGTKTVNAVAGVATFSNLALSGVGSSTLSFSSPTLTSATSSSIGVTAIALAITTQPGNTATGGLLTPQPMVQVRDVNNVLVSSSTAPVTVSVASGPGTLAGTKTVNAVAGVATFSNLSLTGVGSYTLSFASPGVTSVTSGTVAVSSTVLTSLSRDGGSAAGGAKVTLTGGGFAADAVVKFDGVAAPSVTFVNATTLNVIAPTGTATNPIFPTAVAVSVTTGGATATLNNAWTYWPAPTSVLGTADFESGMNGTGGIKPFTTPVAGSSLTVTTEQSHGGAQSLKQVSGSTADNSTTYGGSWAQSDIVGGTGRWHRWYMYFPVATLTSVANHGQIKLFLSRDPTNNFTVVATGPETRDPSQDGANVLGVNNDAGNYHINDASAFLGHYGAEPTITAGVWHEVQVYEYRDPLLGIGYTKVWWDGKKVADSNNVNTTFVPFLSGMGDNNPSATRNAQFGLVYTQNALSYPLVIYIDDISVANGYIDP